MTTKKILQDIVCFDICLELFQYLDILDIVNFFTLSEYINNVYLTNKLFFDRLLIKRILTYFYFEDLFNINNVDDLQSILDTLLKIYKHFRHHRCSHRIDFLLYMLENNLNCDILFEYYANCCTYEYRYDTSNLTRTIIRDENSNLFTNSSQELFNVSFSDIICILIYSTQKQLDIILKVFTIPVSILSYIIDEMLLNNMDEKKIVTIIDYIFYKFC